METGARIDLKTASERSGRTVRHLRSKIKTGELAAVKEGGKLYVRPEDLDVLLDPKRSLEEYARKIVAGWPRFSEERKQELGRLLGPGQHEQEAVRRWASRQAEEAPPMTVEQIRTIRSAFEATASQAEPEPPASRKFSPETDAAIARIVVSAPALSEEQKQRLREILGG